MTDHDLVLKFDPNTIEHLGVSLYSKLPNVISELVSNSWDADANNVFINITDRDDGKVIVYKDDGNGMDYEELKDKYLCIGRNRRKEGFNTTSGGRKVIGKKGLGKLAVFGICNKIELTSTKNGFRNKFRMDIDEIKKPGTSTYYPDILEKNTPTSDPNGIELVLSDIRRKSHFNCDELEMSLAKKFVIFDKINILITYNDEPREVITNELKFSGFEPEFEWQFPLADFATGYEFESRISGKIFTLKTPIKDTEMKGVYLTSRGKIVNNASFYGLRDTDLFHTYVTGYLEVDFIDEFREDVIGTDRQSLNWETNETKELNEYLQKAIKKIGAEWKKRRADLKGQRIKDEADIDIVAWQDGLPSYERELSRKIVNPILESSSIDIGTSTALIRNVVDKFDNVVFKQYASRIAELDKPEEIPMLLGLLDEWKTIEAQQLSNIAISRIEVIKKFEDHLNTDTKEVPTLHNFLKQFSWLLDPRILEFRDEVTYSKLLKESFPETTLDVKDKRIDFLCSNALGGILYVVEIKRSKYKVDVKALEQAYEYNAFLRDKYASVTGFTKVVCFVVGGEKSTDPLFRRKEETYMQTSEVFVKTYYELLEQSKQFHREFIDAYSK